MRSGCSSCAPRRSTAAFTIRFEVIIVILQRGVDIWVLQGGLDPNKISGLGVDFEHLVRCLLLGNKDAACKPSMIFR